MKKVSFITLICVILISLSFSIGCSNTPKQSNDIWSMLQRGDDDVRGFFLSEVEVNAVDSSGKTPLHYAVERNDAALTGFFISIGANVNALDYSRQSPLAISIENNDSITASILVRAGADIHQLIRNNTTAAALALEKDSLIFNSILTTNNIELTDSEGKTVLHMASIAGNYSAVNDIIFLVPNSTAYINKKDNFDKNALDYALERPDSKRHMDTAEHLILSGAFSENPIFHYLGPAVRSANYNIRRNEGLAPIHYAVINDYEGLISYLLDRNVDLNSKTTSGATALHEAVRNGNIFVISMLLEKSADVNARDAKGNTPLHTGIPSRIPSNVHKEIVLMLLEKGADPNLRDEHGDTPLHIAIILNRDWDVVQAILDSGSDVHIRNIEGKTPLHIAVQERRSWIIPLLLSYGSEIFAADNSGITPFDIALRANDITFINIITSETIIQRDSEGNTMLHNAVLNNASPDQISRILDQRAPADSRNRDGDTALHFAVRMNQKENGEFLISRGASIFALNGFGLSPLYIALSSTPMREWIINPDTIIARDGLGNSILHFAAEWNLNNAIPVILRSGISIESRNATGQTPLFMSIRTDNISTIKLLVDNNANLNTRDNQGNSVLHAAVRWNAFNSASFLITSGIDINAHSLNGNTPLHDAVALGISDIESLLIMQGANLESRNMDGNTPLMVAVRAALIPSIEKLTMNGADSSTRDTRGDTPLHIAVSMERYDIAGILLNLGTSIHARNTWNRTPFQISISVSTQMVSALLTADRINIPDDMGSSVLHIALQEGASPDIIRRIINLGARINAVDNNGKTPLRVAIDMGEWESVKIIADTGADPFIVAVDNRTPAEIAFTRGNECLRAIFSGRAINARDNSGNTILHLAARYGTPSNINLLLDLGANRTIRNIASETAYDIALRWSRFDNADALRNQ